MDLDKSPFVDRIVDWVKSAAPSFLPAFFLRRRERAKQQKHFDAALDHQTEKLTGELRESIKMLEVQLQESNDALAKMRVDHEWAIHKERLKVDQERLELERTIHLENVELQRELELKRSELEAHLAAYRRESALQKIQAGIALGTNNPLRATVENILRQQTTPEQVIVILAPYHIDVDSSQQVSAPASQQYITNEIGSFIDRYDSHRVRLLSGAWKDKSYQGATAAGEVFGLLQSEPVLILESTIENDKLSLQAWFWGRNWNRQENLRLLSNFPYLSVLNRIASRHAHEWRQLCTDRCGTEQDAFEQSFLSRPEDAHNWTELQKLDQAHGAYDPQLAYTTRHWDEFNTILSAWHCLAIGMLADGYFLTQYYSPLLFPTRFPELLTQIQDATVRSELTAHFLNSYRDLLATYRQERPGDYYYLVMMLATAIAKLPDKTPAVACAQEAIRAWFHLWGDALPDYLKPDATRPELLVLPSHGITLIQERDKKFAEVINAFPLLHAKDNAKARNNLSKGNEDSHMNLRSETQTMRFGGIEYSLVNTAVDAFEELRQSMNAHVDDVDLKAEANDLGSELQEAFAILENGLRTPKITIAITGGTNSGKSTFVNLLAGAELAPVEFQEMTAGLTTIKKGAQTRMIIEDTPDPNPERLWQPGIYDGLSEDEIQEKLKELMLIYNKIREEHRNFHQYGGNPPREQLPHPPRIIIQHPNVLDRLSVDTLQLPANVEIELIDLPGVTDPGDQENVHLTREVATSNGICIIVCDASNFNARSVVDAIVDEAIDSLKRLGSSDEFAKLAPRRILFLLNKIDVPVMSGTPLDDIVERAKTQILAKICHSIPEIKPWTERFTFVFLSGGIAQFYDILTRTPVEQRVLHLNKKRNKIFLQDDQIEDVLLELGGRRKAERWGIRQWEQMLEAIEDAKNKYQSEELFDVLTAHIKDHFPVLVLPQLFEPVINQSAKKACDWAREIVSVKSKRSKTEYDQRVTQLKELKETLAEVTQEQYKKLNPIFTFVNRIEQESTHLRNKLEKTQENTDKDIKAFSRGVQTWSDRVTIEFLEANTLKSVSSWIYGIEEDIEVFMTAIGGALSQHSSELEQASKHRLLSAQTKIKLQYTIESLVEKGYRRMLKNVSNVDYIHTQDIALARRFQDDLHKLADQVSTALEELLQNRIKLEANRFISVLNTIIKAYGKDLSTQVNELTEKYELSELNFLLDIPIRSLDPEIVLDVQLDTISVEEETKQKYEERYEKRREGKTGLKWLWAGLKDAFAGPKKITVTVNYKVGKIPTAAMMYNIWRRKGGLYFVIAAQKLCTAWAEQIRISTEDLSRMQQKVLDKNIQLIEKEAQHVARRHDQELGYWKDATAFVEKMEHAIQEAGTMLGEKFEYASSEKVETVA